MSDAKVSTYYSDAETNKGDSERAAARILRKALTSAVSASTSTLSPASKSDIAASLLAKIKKSEAELGLVFESVQVRGFFPVADNVPTKIRAYETPFPDLEGPGHDLSADCNSPPHSTFIDFVYRLV